MRAATTGTTAVTPKSDAPLRQVWLMFCQPTQRRAFLANGLQQDSQTHTHAHTVQHGTTLSAVAFVAPTIKRINSELYSYVVFSPLSSFFSCSAIVLYNSFFFLFLFSQLLLERFVNLFVFVRLSFAAQLSCLCGANKFHILPRATSTIYRDRRLPFPTSPSTHRTRTNSTLAPLCSPNCQANMTGI